MSHPWYLPTENPVFVATYDRPKWALDTRMDCGHPVASLDLRGICQRCAIEASMASRTASRRKAMRVKR